MTNTKWLRRALLSGVALSVMATGAQADELADLKAQLEALFSRVHQLEQQPTRMPLSENASVISIARGSGNNEEWRLSRVHDDIPSDRGFTISVTPTADVPAPVAEVVVYGYVKGDVIIDIDKDVGDAFYVPNIWSQNGRNDQHVRLHAKQSRFGIRSKVDTAVGQVRTLVEGDFFTGDKTFRLRHAWGEWDMMPSWTLSAGQNYTAAGLLPIGITTVDFSGAAGPLGYDRVAQVRLTYQGGPLSWAIAVEQPRLHSAAEWPNIAAYLQYEAPGGHQFIITGVVADWDNDDPDLGGSHDIGWAVNAGANFVLGDIVRFTAGAAYGRREVCHYLNQDDAWCGKFVSADKDGVVDFFADEGYGVFAGVTFDVSDTTSVNLGSGWTRLVNDKNFESFESVKRIDIFTIHGNVLWQPVKQLRLGWEVMWGQYNWTAGDDFGVDNNFNPNDPESVNQCARRHGCAKKHDDAIRAQFGAWFYF